MALARKDIESVIKEVVEKDTDAAQALASIEVIRDVLPICKARATSSEVALAALVYSLRETKVLTEDGEVKAKWQVASLVYDKDGNLLPFSKTWPDFCYIHLDMDPTMASVYKRVWEIFAVDLGMSLDDLMAAGIHKLRLAVGEVARLYPEIDLPLHEALFGNENKCASCGYETDSDTEVCPSCGEPFAPMPPGSAARIALRIQQLRARPEEVGKDFKVLADLRTVMDEGKATGWIIAPQAWQEEEFVSYIPPWQIDIVEDDAPSDTMGVRVSHANLFYEWLRRHFS